ncbi:MAG TPA: SUMF1/EgtB/PvdO family nonheme iron enzyme [Polyangia bacterium]|jgi:formylglycine-generating enzyme required for sulfatase activity
MPRVLILLSFAAGVALGLGRGAAARTPTPPAPAPPAGMVRVPAGEFIMGDDAGEEDEQPARRVWLDGFFIDRTEVTRGAYARCVAARACPAPARYPDPTSAHHPVVGVSWEDAAAFCRFAGKRLPTEAEWEKAARGTDGRRYPWGNEPDCSRANYGNFQGEGACEGASPGRPVPVGSYPAGRSPAGADDLAGNVWEWVADWYELDYYRHAPARNPPGPDRGEGRVLRGGACCSMFVLPRAANRLRFAATYRDGDIGFRCARAER